MGGKYVYLVTFRRGSDVLVYQFENRFDAEHVAAELIFRYDDIRIYSAFLMEQL